MKINIGEIENLDINIKNESLDMDLVLEDNYPIVSIGASAGGLEALERLFDYLPLDTDAAYVVIQHLSPDHKSIMDSLLARHTKMPISIVSHEMRVNKNNVYLIPPGAFIELQDDKFLIRPKDANKLNYPIDVFLKSIAENFKRKIISVILSGTGSDGSNGSAEVKRKGGVVIAQSPDEAKFDGMPRSVISTGIVDHVADVKSMAEIIKGYIDNSLKIKPWKDVEIINEDKNIIYDQIIKILLNNGGVDFQDYKNGTVYRRIDRRMMICKINSLSEYLQKLRDDSDELDILRRDLLICVTDFFRDPQAFEELKNSFIKDLLGRKTSEDVIRIWCAGIGTGEEAYSTAILFQEAFDDIKIWPQLKIFATDIEQSNVDFASAGLYPENKVTNLSSSRLERFFTKDDKGYTVKNELRQKIVFAKHNLLTHPPFTKMDLVVCRNVLIYFNSEAQAKVLQRLFFALNPNGCLFLGSSESIGSLQDDCTNISSKYKIWKVNKKYSSLSRPIQKDIFSHLVPLSSQKRASRLSSFKIEGEKKSVIQLGIEALFENFSPPPSILIDRNHEIIHSYGDASKYVQIKSGSVSLEINKLLPDNIAPVVSTLLFKTFRENVSAVSDVLFFSQNNNKNEDKLRISAWPVRYADKEENSPEAVLIVFENIEGQVKSILSNQTDIEKENYDRIRILQDDLAATRESLQATIEELETSNEELQATNEEMMASNEELQSSNEELQSVNEELNTINSEYQEKIEILNRVNADLDNLTRVVASGTVFLDNNLCIKRFSQDATEIFKLRSTDLGRPLGEIVNSLDYPELNDDLRKCIESNELLEKEVKSVGNKIYKVRMLPYSASHSAINGIVINFVEISLRHLSSKLLASINSKLYYFAVFKEDGNIIFLKDKFDVSNNFLFSDDFNINNIRIGGNIFDFINSSTHSWSLILKDQIEICKNNKKINNERLLDEELNIKSSVKRFENIYMIEISN